MGESILIDRIAQGSDDMVLSQDVIKRFGSIFSGKNLVAHEGRIEVLADLS
jgi:hypothetical protein